MTLPRLAHLGIAVQAHDEALRFWRDLLGLPLEHIEVVAGDGVRVAMLRLGAPGAGAGAPTASGGATSGGASGGAVELLEPTADDSPVGRFLGKRGPGIHHLALEVDDLAALFARLKAAGVRLIDAAPRRGAHGTTVCFVHPQSTGGVLLELVQSR